MKLLDMFKRKQEVPETKDIKSNIFDKILKDMEFKGTSIEMRLRAVEAAYDIINPKDVDWDYIRQKILQDPIPYDYRIDHSLTNRTDLGIWLLDIKMAKADETTPWVNFKCKDCGKIVEMSRQHVNFFRDHSLEEPKRCDECIKKRKELLTN